MVITTPGSQKANYVNIYYNVHLKGNGGDAAASTVLSSFEIAPEDCIKAAVSLVSSFLVLETWTNKK